jgi:cytochrome c biogenesis protein
VKTRFQSLLSNATCTATPRQLPVWRVSADWKFLDRPAALLKMEEAETLPRAKSTDLADLLAQRGYQAGLVALFTTSFCSQCTS